MFVTCIEYERINIASEKMFRISRIDTWTNVFRKDITDY